MDQCYAVQFKIGKGGQNAISSFFTDTLHVNDDVINGIKSLLSSITSHF